MTGRGSPSLTSEVVADTKCRQELVEVISKPWGGQDGGLSRGLGVPRQRGALGWRGLTSRAERSGWGFPRRSEGGVWVSEDPGELLHWLGGSAGVSEDVGGLCHRPRGNVGVPGDIGGLLCGLGDSTSPTRCSTALRSSSAGGLQPTMLWQMPTMCWHCG